MKEFYPIILALGFNGIDLITGVFTALKAHNLQSSKLRDGLFKKFGFFICYFLAWVIDTHGHLVGFQFGIPLLPVVVFYVCGTELVSILENVCILNPDLKKAKLFDLFQIKE